MYSFILVLKLTLSSLKIYLNIHFISGLKLVLLHRNMNSLLDIKKENKKPNDFCKTIKTLAVGNFAMSSMECKDEDIDIKEEPIDTNIVSKVKLII